MSKNSEVRFLNPVDSRKSFYKKAFEYDDADGNIICVSYGTRVARITSDGKCEVKGLYSATTTRHIKSFLTLHGFPYNDSKNILERYQA